MIQFPINEYNLKKLLSCSTKTKGRDFRGWSIEALMAEAVHEFYEKYGPKGVYPE